MSGRGKGEVDERAKRMTGGRRAKEDRVREIKRSDNNAFGAPSVPGDSRRSRQPLYCFTSVSRAEISEYVAEDRIYIHIVPICTYTYLHASSMSRRERAKGGKSLYSYGSYYTLGMLREDDPLCDKRTAVVSTYLHYL